jgi:rhodanese-related sulfurtransferase
MELEVMKTVSRMELKKIIGSGQNIQLVDVRGKECCYDNGHLPGAISIPINELEARAPEELEKDEPLIVYCGSLSCSLSPRAAHLLEDHLGFKDVTDYEGGIKDWMDAGFPIEK